MNDHSISRLASSRYWICLAFVLASLLFAACAPQPAAPTGTGASPTPPASSLAGTKWKLVSFGKPGAETPVIAGSTITIAFSAEGKASGSGGCNSYSAAYERMEDKLSFGAIASTKMACTQGGIGQQEQSYFNALQAAARFELTADRLVIWYDNGQAVLNWQAALN